MRSLEAELNLAIESGIHRKWSWDAKPMLKGKELPLWMYQIAWGKRLLSEREWGGSPEKWLNFHCYPTELGYLCVLLNWTWVHSPTAQQSQFCDTGLQWREVPHLLLLCAGHQAHAQNHQAHAQKTWTPQWAFQVRIFKGNISDKGCSVHDFLFIG